MRRELSYSAKWMALDHLDDLMKMRLEGWVGGDGHHSGRMLGKGVLEACRAALQDGRADHWGRGAQGTVTPWVMPEALKTLPGPPVGWHEGRSQPGATPLTLDAAITWGPNRRGEGGRESV